MLTHKVKVNAVDNLSDARYCAGMFVDFIGFSLKNDQNEWVDSARINEMANWLSGVTMIGELKSTEWPTNPSDYPCQIWETDDISLFNEKKKEGFSMAFRMDAMSNFSSTLVEKLVQDAAYIRIDNASETMIESLEQFHENIFFNLSSDLVERTIWNSYSSVQLAIDGGKEIRPGHSDFGSLMDVLEALDE